MSEDEDFEDDFWGDLPIPDREEITEIIALHNAHEAAASILLDSIQIIKDHQPHDGKRKVALAVAETVLKLRQSIQARGASEHVEH